MYNLRMCLYSVVQKKCDEHMFFLNQKQLDYVSSFFKYTCTVMLHLPMK